MRTQPARSILLAGSHVHGDDSIGDGVGWSQVFVCGEGYIPRRRCIAIVAGEIGTCESGEEETALSLSLSNDTDLSRQLQ